MANLTTTYNKAKTTTGFRTIPAGTYTVIINQADLQEKAGNEWIKMRYMVIENDNPKVQGFAFHNIIMMYHTNKKSMKWGHEILTKIWQDALGEKGMPEDSDNLLGRKLVVDVVIEEQAGQIQNVIKAYRPYVPAEKQGDLLDMLAAAETFNVDEATL